MQPPSTAQVLELIGQDGVVVGSVARTSSPERPVDLVVRAPSDDEPAAEHFALRRVLAEWPEHCEQATSAHLRVNATPVSVHLYASASLPLGDPHKDARRTTYRQARRHCSIRPVHGIAMQVLDPTLA